MTHAKRSLRDYVRNAQSTNDIMHLLTLLPFQTIQDSILEVIGGLNTDTANAIRYKCCSITDILPDDITQHIISFTDSLDMKYVNKSFNNCCNKNKALELKHRQQIIDEQVFNPIVKYEQHNKTWIVHPTRTRLNNEEIANGYGGPLNTLNEAADTVQPGDKLLFCDGEYDASGEDQFLDEFRFMIEEYDPQIIGVGNNVLLKFAEVIDIYCNDIYFKNVKIEMNYHWGIATDSSLFMEDCEIMMGGRSIDVGAGATFSAKNCVFSGTSGTSGRNVPITLEYDSKNVSIVGCTFTQHKQEACIGLYDYSGKYDEIVDDPIPDTRLKCVGNIFKNNFGYPIAINKAPPRQVREILESMITHNILEGYNGVNVDVIVNSANTIYWQNWK
eukprot:573701_1